MKLRNLQLKSYLNTNLLRELARHSNQYTVHGGCLELSNQRVENATVRELEKSNVSRYLQLASLFYEKVSSGAWPVGQRIPTVKDLSKENGVATMTIRQALNLLEKDGLIERFRAKGTFVRKRPVRDLWCDIGMDWSRSLAMRDGAEVDIVSDEHNTLLPRYDGEIGTPAPKYRRLKRTMSRAGTPYLFSDVFVEEALSHLIPDADLTEMTAMRLISDIPDHPVVSAKQIITISVADLEKSSLLNISIGDPVVKVQRSAMNAQGRIMLLANGFYRSGTMKIETELR